MSDELKARNEMVTLPGHSWFLIHVSWDYEDDSDAVEKWQEVFNWFRRKPDPDGEHISYRDEIADEGLLALNLIAKRQFVIAGQAKSNKPLQQLGSMITLGTPLRVEVFAATNVFEFGNINIKKLGIKIDSSTGQVQSA